MVENPAQQFVDYQKAGARKVIFHFESAPNPDEVIKTARQLELTVGLAVNPETDISSIYRLYVSLDSVSFFLPSGFYGAKIMK